MLEVFVTRETVEGVLVLAGLQLMGCIVQHHTVDTYLQVKRVVLFLDQRVVLFEYEEQETLDFLQVGFIEKVLDILFELAGVFSLVVSPNLSEFLYFSILLSTFSYNLIVICLFLHLL